ncbi:MAG: hypothetical protein HQL99_15940 [Magnetococcales bacterium]|nr:hypothetical protein [Magnetococcales bacterium]
MNPSVPDQARLAIAFVRPDSPDDDRLQATLNRFHFRRLRLVSPARSSRWQLVLDRHGELTTVNEEGAAVPLSRRYWPEARAWLAPYVEADGPIKNLFPTRDPRMPGLDQLADALETELITRFQLSSRPASASFGVVMSHDVDGVGHYWRAHFKSGAIFLANALRTATQGGISRYCLYHGWRFLTGQVRYHGFDHILTRADTLGFRPTFFFYARLPDRNKLTRFQHLYGFNPNYDLESPYMRAVLRKLVEGGARIGLHGSYASANDPELLAREWRQLQRVIGQPVHCTRQHYLNFEGRATLRMYQDLGLTIDSTCGYTFANGFLCGTTRPFYGCLPVAGKPAVVVVPMAFMDAIPLYYRPTLPEQIFEQELRPLLEQIRQYGGMASFNLHQRMFGVFPGFRELYEEIAWKIRAMNGHLVSFQDIDTFYPDSEFHHER